ncbi:MAG: hypothetical protein Q9M45_12580 [Robiginitomaculum sp.]|nr:hypothetical protein [Robiginitomaculum sp.]
MRDSIMGAQIHHLSTNQRNPGVPYHPEWVESIRVNRSAIERRISTLAARRTVKKRMAGRLAAQGHFPDRSDHLVRR